MRLSKLASLILIPAGLTVFGPVASAQGYYGDRYSDPYGRQDLREDRRDLRNDYTQVDRLRADLARDQYQLNQALRFGDRRLARRIARDMDRDQRRLDALLRDIARDRRDIRRDQRGRDWDRGYRNY